MKATPRQQLMLLDLQRLDHTLARLRKRNEQLPERAELTALETEREQVRNTYMDAQRELDARRLELTRIESDVEVVEQRVARDNEMLAASTSSKEAVALQSELDTLGRRKGELEERQLEAMEVAEAAEGVFSEAERVLAGVDERRAGINERIAAAEAQTESDRGAAETERAGLAAEVRGDLLALYEKTRAQVGIGAARLRAGVSEASGMALSPADLSTIKAAPEDEIVFCPETGAILVRVIDE
ncbi:zinc ribbon domain-containing protein [Leucobacter albus]|uniref:Zinc ribbon domain-containing protein n=1 Tax=Leucobacter albus TaxID=272210 RepID=A0ABW3TJF6_9MICO